MIRTLNSSEKIIKKKNKKILIVLLLGIFIGAFDISVIGPAISSIKETLNLQARSLSWIFSINVLFTLVFTPLTTRLSDTFSKKKIFIITISIFAVGSLVVALSNSFEMLLTGRAIQGIGVSGIFPVVPAIIGDVVAAEKRGRALGLIGAVFGIASILGPIAAGVLLYYFSWNALFIINIPIALFIVLAGIKFLPDYESKDKSKFDWWGTITLGFIVGLFAFGISKINTGNFPQSLIYDSLPYFLFSCILLIVFIFIERKEKAPIFKSNIINSRQIKIVIMIAIGTGIFQASFIFIPNMIVDVFHTSPSKASFMLMPIVIAMAVGSPLAGRLVDKIGTKFILFTGLTLVSVGLILLSNITNQMYLFYFAGILFGFGVSTLESSSLRYILLNEVSNNERTSAQGMLSIFISTGQLLGASLIGAIATSYSGKLSSGYNAAYLYIAFLAIPLIVISIFLKSRKKEIETFR